jgi:hypothetical protein
MTETFNPQRKAAPMKERKPITPEPMTPPNTPVGRALCELIEMGLVEDSGERRNGRIVWRLSPFGEKVAAQKPEQ